jgi:hypothetical protein
MAGSFPANYLCRHEVANRAFDIILKGSFTWQLLFSTTNDEQLCLMMFSVTQLSALVSFGGPRHGRIPLPLAQYRAFHRMDIDSVRISVEARSSPN